jgi:hypothetical protein
MEAQSKASDPRLSRGSGYFLCLSKESNQRKDTPMPHPLFAGALRSSASRGSPDRPSVAWQATRRVPAAPLRAVSLEACGTRCVIGEGNVKTASTSRGFSLGGAGSGGGHVDCSVSRSHTDVERRGFDLLPRMARRARGCSGVKARRGAAGRRRVVRQAMDGLSNDLPGTPPRAGHPEGARHPGVLLLVTFPGQARKVTRAGRKPDRNAFDLAFIPQTRKTETLAGTTTPRNTARPSPCNS